MNEIEKLLEQFQLLNDDERYVLLATFFEGAADGDALTWRAELCTALERAGLYPQDRPIV